MKPKRTKTKRPKPARKPVSVSARSVVITRWHVVKARIEAEVTAQVSRRGFTGSVSLHPGKLSYHHDGSDGVVLQADLEKYAASMVEKGLASSASTDNKHVEIALTARTVSILTGTKNSRPPKPKSVPATEAKERASPLEQPFAIPGADQIMEAVLATVKGKAVQRAAVRSAVARSLRVPPDKIKLAVCEPGSFRRTSFSETFGLVVGHLQKAGVLKADGKKLVALPNPDNKPVPPYEPSSKKAKARAAQPKIARLSGQINVQRLVKTLPDQDPYKLLSMWKNAVRITGDKSQTHRHQEAAVLATAISKEWGRRAKTLADDAYFRWPTTDAPGGRRKEQYRDLRHEGMLKYLDYKVGKEGEHSSYRHALLSRIFENALPPVFDRLYMEEWGPNASSIRLHKMAHCLASFAKNFKYQNNDKYDEAIRHWEQDLEYLHDRYYVGRFGFGWPTTVI
ncbi:hypothetical protein [Rhizobium sp. YS-1r]|uniref:hypothetical protein n=1 Tax=Rhizobium sp. YS-1r TaxID=1532558 RepID=UPI00068B18F2|nr:hypothetical protein [Rhizobium sp. YS-1r]